MSVSSSNSLRREKLMSAFVIGTSAALLLALALHAGAARLDGGMQNTVRGGEFLLLALGCSIGWIATLDVMAQRAHYVAFYWGGSVGLMFAGALVMLVASGAADPMFYLGQPGSLSSAFVSGGLATWF